MPPGQVLLMQRFYSSQVVLEQRRERSGKGGEPILVAFPRPDRQLLHLIVDVLNPQPNRFHDAQPTAMWSCAALAAPSISESTAATSSRVITTKTVNLLAARTASMLSAREWLGGRTLIEEHQGIHRLITGSGERRCHKWPSPVQKRLDCGSAGRGPRADRNYGTGQSGRSVHIRALSMNRVVVETRSAVRTHRKSWLLTCCRGRRHQLSRDSGLRAVIISFPVFCPKTSSISHIRAKWQVNQWLGAHITHR